MVLKFTVDYPETLPDALQQTPHQTGSIGILLHAKKEGDAISISTAIQRMQNHGVYLSERVILFALNQSGDTLLQ